MVAFKDNFFKKLKAASGATKQKLLAEHERELERLKKELERERAKLLEQLRKKLLEKKKGKVDAQCAELMDLRKDLMTEMTRKLDEIEKQKSKIKAEYGIDDKEFDKELNAFALLQQDPADKERIDSLKEMEMQWL